MRKLLKKTLSSLLMIVVLFTSACQSPDLTLESSEPLQTTTAESEDAGTTESATVESSTSEGATSEEATTTEAPTTAATTTEATTTEATTTEAATEEATTTTTTAATEVTTTTTPSKTGIKIPAKSAAKGLDYFANTLFIGDSRLQSLMMYGTLSSPDYVTGRGFSLSAYFDDPVPIQGQEQIAANFVAKNAGKYTDIYINVGLNESGYSKNGFINMYTQLLDHVSSNNPNATIYLNSIVSITESRDANERSKNGYITNANIASFNEVIKNLAVEYSAYYLDVNPLITNASGFLPESISPDGVHFDRKSVQVWQEYIQTHVVPR